MNPIRPTEVVPGIYQLRTLGAMATVFMEEQGAVLVDAGGRGSLPLLERGLKALGLSLDQVRLIVLTHYHPDHTGALARLVAATGAQVAAHHLETQFIDGDKRPPNPFQNQVVATIAQPFLPAFYGQPVRVDFPLEDGQMLPFAEGVRVVHTPGHTPGSISLHLVAKRLLIVGDALQYRFGRLGPPPPAVTWDPAQARESIRKMAALGVDTLCFSHAPPLKADAQQALRRLVEKLEARRARPSGRSGTPRWWPGR